MAANGSPRLEIHLLQGNAPACKSSTNPITQLFSTVRSYTTQQNVDRPTSVGQICLLVTAIWLKKLRGETAQSSELVRIISGLDVKPQAQYLPFHDIPQLGGDRRFTFDFRHHNLICIPDHSANGITTPVRWSSSELAPVFLTDLSYLSLFPRHAGEISALRCRNFLRADSSEESGRIGCSWAAGNYT